MYGRKPMNGYRSSELIYLDFLSCIIMTYLVFFFKPVPFNYFVIDSEYSTRKRAAPVAYLFYVGTCTWYPPLIYGCKAMTTDFCPTHMNHYKWDNNIQNYLHVYSLQVK